MSERRPDPDALLARVVEQATRDTPAGSPPAIVATTADQGPRPAAG